MISFRERAWKDYLYWQETDKHILKRINALIKVIHLTDSANLSRLSISFPVSGRAV
jgi:Txe/YoeB family toxin of Txe-Axe toxin-antitoxin module